MTPIEMMFNGVEWEAMEGEPPTDGSLYATHTGILKLGFVQFRVFQLSDGQRVIDAGDLEQFFKGASE